MMVRVSARPNSYGSASAAEGETKPGAGLGLAIAREIVRLNDGTMTFGKAEESWPRCDRLPAVNDGSDVYMIPRAELVERARC
jgi:hypothetical protein